MSAELFQRPEIYYYRHNGTTVTSRYFTTPYARYLVRDLTRFAQSQRAAESGFKVGLITAVVELAIVQPASAVLKPAVGFALIVPALVIPFLAAWIHSRRHPAEFELIANYRGLQQVTLFATSDQQQFGQVARALMRAAEASRR